ncbi:MAG: glycosyltransferase family 4 protein [Gammaproteobacteria bacterium]|nr:glycosyltransferase family 4 protein [Gammaproteobacteria bacterium]
MRIALVVPGGVDPSGEYRVIPALLALVRRLARTHDLQVFALRQQVQPGEWELCGARVCNIGARHTRLRCIGEIRTRHRERAFDLIHALWSGTPGLVAVAAARVLGIPSVVHVAGGELTALPAIAYGEQLTWKGRVREAAVLHAATQVTAASGPMIAALAARGVAAERVPLGVDLERWAPRQPVRRNVARRARLIHVASLNRVKDQHTLLRTLVALRGSGVDFEMHIVGEDTLGGEMQALALELGLAAQITFHGFLPHRELRPLMEDSDVMVLSSRHEAGPLALHEAAVVGVPTVGTAVGEIADWAPHAALAAPVGDEGALARHIAALLADEELRLQVAHAAFAAAISENADCTASSFEAIYQRLTAC